MTEDPYEQRTNLGNLDLFDLIFTNDAGSVHAYGDKGRHLPFSADLDFHRHEIPDAANSAHYIYDLFFAGTAWPNRAEFLRELQHSIDGIRMKLAFPHNPHIPEPALGLDPSSYQWRTSNPEFARFANRSRAVLTLHRAFSSSGDIPVARTPGPRLFEVALAGGFQLIDMSIPDIEVGNYFVEGTDFVGFTSVQDCAEKLRYYLANPDKRIEIARSAQKRAMSEHLYAHRIETLLSEVDRLTGGRRLAAQPKTFARPRILFVTHNIAGIQPYGGVEVYQEQIRQSLRDCYEFFFYTPDRRVNPLGSRCVLYGHDLDYIEDHEFPAPVSDADLVSPERERVFSSILSRYRIELVHFQHLIGHVPSLLYMPKSLGIPSAFSLHDYYGICAHFNLIDYRGRYCNVASLPKPTCDICLNASDGIAAGAQARRRAFFGRALDQMDMLHANTEGVANLYRAIYPNLFDRERVMIFGVPMPIAAPVIKQERTCDLEEKLKVAVLGNFTRNKGADEIIHAFNQLRHDPIEFTIFGTIAQPYDAILSVLQLPNVVLHGPYTAGTISEKLSMHSLSLHFSIWPETYCITLSEAWQAGLVPVVSDIGALGERVRHGVNGFKVPNTEAGALVEILRELAYNKKSVEDVRARITQDLYVDAGTHMAWLSDVYSGLLSARSLVNIASSEGERTQGRALADLGIIVNQVTWSRLNSEASPIVPQPMAQPMPISMGRRVLSYAKMHGVMATWRRIKQEVFGSASRGGQP